MKGKKVGTRQAVWAVVPVIAPVPSGFLENTALMPKSLNCGKVGIGSLVRDEKIHRDESQISLFCSSPIHAVSVFKKMMN